MKKVPLLFLLLLIFGLVAIAQTASATTSPGPADSSALLAKNTATTSVTQPADCNVALLMSATLIAGHQTAYAQLTPVATGVIATTTVPVPVVQLE